MERRSIAKLAAQIGGVRMPQHISIRDNTFSAVDDTGQREPIGPLLHCVVIDMNEKMSRIYWGKGYDGEDKSPPLCFSDNGVAPSVHSFEPQAKSCAPDRTGEFGCKWSVWGSATGKGGVGIPACREGVKLALILVALENRKWVPMLKVGKFEIPPGTVWAFWVPPYSTKVFASYAKMMGGMGNFDVPWTGEEAKYDVSWMITRISFRGQGALLFEQMGYLTEQLDGVIGQIDEARVDMFIGRDDEPITALPAPEQSENPAALPEPRPSIAAERKQRGRPRKDNGAPPAAAKPFEPKPNARIVTAEDVRNEARARQEQEQKEAEAEKRDNEALRRYYTERDPKFGITEEAPEPPEDVLSQFMNLDLK